MTLGEAQRDFTRHLPRLIDWMVVQGFTPVIGEVYRPPETAALYAAQGRGIASSLHTLKLAADIFLFHDGSYLTSYTDYAPAGDYWKSLDPRCAWGGDFATLKDGNHFSLSYQGRR